MNHELPHDLTEEAAQLGDVTEVYQLSMGRFLRGLLLNTFGACMGAVLILVGGGTLTGLWNPNLNFSTFMLVLALVVGLVMFPASLHSLFRLIRNRKQCVLVFTDGFVRIGHNQQRACRWDQVEGVWQDVTKHYHNGIYTGTTYIYTVRTRGGDTIKFHSDYDRLKNIDKLGQTLQRESSRRLFPRYLETFNAGGTVHFGSLSVSREGLSNGKELLPWDEVTGVKISQGVLTVGKKGKWLNWSTVPVSQIPNFHLLTVLVDQIVGVKKK